MLQAYLTVSVKGVRVFLSCFALYFLLWVLFVCCCSVLRFLQVHALHFDRRNALGFVFFCYYRICRFGYVFFVLFYIVYNLD